MINQALSLLCDGSHCLKARNYTPDVLRYLKVTARLGRASGLALLAAGCLSLQVKQCHRSWPGNEPAMIKEWSPKLLARAPQAATNLNLSG